MQKIECNCTQHQTKQFYFNSWKNRHLSCYWDPWEPFLEQTKKEEKLGRTNGILSKLRYYVSKETLTSIFNSLFQSHIVYGSTVWSFTSQKNIKKIFVLQKKCLLTFSDYHQHTSPIFKSLKVLKLQDIKFSILKLIYFYFNDQLPLQVY